MLLFNALFLTVAFANINRIESKRVESLIPTKIYFKFGLVSVVEFPKEISEVRVGNPNIVKAIISNVSSKELTLYYKNNTHVSTNVIVKSGKEVFVLDVIPSNTTHQDFVQIKGKTVSNKKFHIVDQIDLSPNLRKSKSVISEVIKL